jgi:hypothetical protein
MALWDFVSQAKEGCQQDDYREKKNPSECGVSLPLEGN